MDEVQPDSNGLQPKNDGLQSKSDGPGLHVFSFLVFDAALRWELDGNGLLQRKSQPSKCLARLGAHGISVDVPG